MAHPANKRLMRQIGTGSSVHGTPVRPMHQNYRCDESMSTNRPGRFSEITHTAGMLQTL